MLMIKNRCICVAIFASTIILPNLVNAGLPMETAWKASENIVVPPMQHKSLTFPAIKKKDGYVVCLAFKAYLYKPTPSGWNPYIALSLNGTQLNKFTRYGNKRLLCRGEMFSSTYPGDERRPWWGIQGGKPSIMAYFGPGTGEIDKRITSAREEGYDYFLDISDTVNYFVVGADDIVESAKPNTLTLFNPLATQYKSIMHYDNIRVGYVKKSLVDKAGGAKLVEFKRGTPAASLKGSHFTLQVMECGGMLLENNGDEYYFKSLFSYPDAKKTKYSELGIGSCTGYSTWKPEIHRKGNKIEISAVNKNITLLRMITIENDHIAIHDKLTNTADEDAGTAVSNIIGVKSLPEPGSFRMSGMESDFENKCAENPTCFITRKNSSVGIVAEDNVLRNQMELFKRSNTFIVSDKNLGIAGGKSYTLEWNIYPLKSRKYFTLINKIRQAWGSNNTVQGPISLFSRDVIDQKIRRMNITIFPIWLEYELPGVKLSRSEYKERFNAEARRVKAIAPDIKLMARTVTSLVTVDITRIPGGEIIPARKSNVRSAGKYGLALTREQTAVLDKTKYADSLIRDANGNALIGTYYVKYPYINLLVRLDLNNYRYKTLCGQIDYMLDDVKADGVYLDMFVPARLYRDISYDKWDGHSVELDDKGNIKQKFYNYALTGSTARAAILKRVLAKGKLIMTNGQPVTRETQGLPVLRFTEGESDHFNPMDFIDKKPPIFKCQTMCQLGCPMILGQRIGYAKWYGSEDQGRNFTKSIITALRNGLLYCYYTNFPKGKVAYGPVNHMFPFTPVELHEGYLIGKERIITCVSGKYVWQHTGKPKCFYFDCRGFDKPVNFKMTKKENQWEIDVTLNDWNEIAVIEK